MGGVEVVETNQEAGAVALVLLPDVVDLLLRGNAEFLRREHDRGAVGVVSADVGAIVAARFLEAHPYVGLHLFQQVAQVQGAVGVGQCAGYQYLARGGCSHDHPVGL